MQFIKNAKRDIYLFVLYYTYYFVSMYMYVINVIIIVKLCRSKTSCFPLSI